MDRRRGGAAEPPEVKPLDVDGVRSMAIITVLWALAFVVLAFFRSELEEADRGWWIWACLAGVGLGLLGLEYCRKRRDAIARAELDAEADAGFDDARDWADGELAALAVDDDELGGDFQQPDHGYSPADQTPPATPLPFERSASPPAAAPPPPAAPPPVGPPRRMPAPTHHTGEHPAPSPSGPPRPGHVTGDFPSVPGKVPPVTAEMPPVTAEFPQPTPRPASPPRPAPPPSPRSSPPPASSGSPPASSAPPRPGYPEPPYAEAAAPAGYSPDPDLSRRHPRDEELARRYREEQARAAAAGYEPPSYPEFLQHEEARDEEVSGADPGTTASPPRRRSVELDSEFFGDEPVTEPKRGADFLLDDDDDSGREYRGRRARRD